MSSRHHALTEHTAVSACLRRGSVGDVLLPLTFETEVGSARGPSPASWVEVETRLLAIYRECSVLVQRRAARILGSESAGQDVTQHVFMKVLADLQAGTDIRNASAYCYRSATNLALNWLRDAHRRNELLTQQRMSEHVEDLAGEGSLLVRQIIAQCAEAEAMVASYFYLDGLDQTEIAALLGWSRRTVNRRLERFNERARRMLTGAASEAKGSNDV